MFFGAVFGTEAGQKQMARIPPPRGCIFKPTRPILRWPVCEPKTALKNIVSSQIARNYMLSDWITCYYDKLTFFAVEKIGEHPSIWTYSLFSKPHNFQTIFEKFYFKPFPEDL